MNAANAPPIAGTNAVKTNLQDLQQFITTTLSGQTGSYTGTQSLFSAAIGTAIELDGIVLTFNATQDNGTKVWSGSVSITATSGAIYSGQPFTATAGAVTGTYTITGTGTGAKTFSLTAKNFSLQIGEALKMVSPSINLTYDGSSSAVQTVAAISNATISSPQFPSLPTASLTNFNLRTDGFSFDNFILTKTFSTSSPLTIGSFFEATGQVSLKITGGLAQNGTTVLPFNVSFSAPENSTAGIQLSADSIRFSRASLRWTSTSPTLPARMPSSIPSTPGRLPIRCWFRPLARGV